MTQLAIFFKILIKTYLKLKHPITAACPKNVRLKFLEKNHLTITTTARVDFLLFRLKKTKTKVLKFKFGALVRAVAPAHTQRTNGVYWRAASGAPSGDSNSASSPHHCAPFMKTATQWIWSLPPIQLSAVSIDIIGFQYEFHLPYSAFLSSAAFKLL